MGLEPITFQAVTDPSIHCAARHQNYWKRLFSNHKRGSGTEISWCQNSILDRFVCLFAKFSFFRTMLSIRLFEATIIFVEWTMNGQAKLLDSSQLAMYNCQDYLFLLRRCHPRYCRCKTQYITLACDQHCFTARMHANMMWFIPSFPYFYNVIALVK